MDDATKERRTTTDRCATSLKGVQPLFVGVLSSAMAPSPESSSNRNRTPVLCSGQSSNHEVLCYGVSPGRLATTVAAF